MSVRLDVLLPSLVCWVTLEHIESVIPQSFNQFFQSVSPCVIQSDNLVVYPTVYIALDSTNAVRSLYRINQPREAFHVWP